MSVSSSRIAPPKSLALRAPATRRAEIVPNAAASAVTTNSNDPLRLGSWRLESLLGEGTFTRVYRARYADAPNPSRGEYAIKVLRRRWHDSAPAIARLRREATVGRCVANSHVVSVLTAHVHQAPYYVVMPSLEGWPVAQQLKQHSRLKLPQALWYARQAAEALEALHTAGYLHGDLKPGNLFVSRQGHLTLIDLGCARRTDDEPTLTDHPLVGTPAYLAPELFAGDIPSVRADLYSLGITLFEMLAGRLPWDETDLAQLVPRKRSGPLPSVRSFVSQVPSEVAHLIGQLTASQPLRRPATSPEVVQSLVKLEISSLAMHLPR